MALDIQNFKVSWKGNWKDKEKYYKNDIVYWRGKSYRCTEETPDNFTISSESMVNTNSYGQYQPYGC